MDTDALVVDGNTGAVSFANNVSLGDGAADDIAINGKVTTSLIPKTGVLDLGSDADRWQDLFLSSATLHIGNSTADEATLSYDASNKSLDITSSATTGKIIEIDKVSKQRRGK